MSHALLRPRQHVHRGTVVAAAFWFDPALHGEAEARRRVLTAWMPGAAVLHVAGGYLLRLHVPRRVDASSASGLPLTLVDGVLASTPLAPSERARLAPPVGVAVLVRGGVAEVHPLTGARAVDLAAWLDVSAWAVVPMKGLGAPPPPVPTLEPVTAPAREGFGPGVPKLAPEAQVMLARMAGREPPPGLVAPRQGLLARLKAWFAAKGTSAAPGSSRVGRPGLLARLRAAFGHGREAVEGTPGRAVTVRRPGLFARFAAWLRGGTDAQAPASGRAEAGRSPSAPAGPPSLWVRMLASLFSVFAGLGAGQGETGAPASGTNVPSTSTSTRPAPSPGPGLLSRLSEWMLRHTPLGRYVGQRKADYVRRLFEMFEEGNLQEALRYAIPLGRGMDEQARLALGVPGPREQLTIQPRSGGPSQVFGGGDALFAALQERYREAFRRFEREGRIDEAAFILAELLGAHEEAVSFLERHGRLRLAAELAEGRNLPPGLVVRQWLLAKDVARAVAIARRSGAFLDAVTRLERSHPKEAQALRLLWAEALAEAGAWELAVNVAWPVPEARALARAWVERGADAGGVAGARLLARWTTAFEDGFARTRERVRALLENEEPEHAEERFAFATALADEPPPPEVRAALLTSTARALLRDRAAGHALLTSDLLARLLKDPVAGTLRADLPPVPDRAPGIWLFRPTEAPLRSRLSEAEAGAGAVYDAVVLSGHRLLLALGEAGVRLVRADGRVLAHFDVPAFALVPSAHGDRALALAPRGEVVRLSRLDLVARRASPWCDARLDAWAHSYDGDRWFVSVGDTVMMVDALANDFCALWRVAEVGGRVLALDTDGARLAFLVWSERPERWAYELPGGPTLRHRAELPGEGLPMAVSLTADGEVAMAALAGTPEAPERRLRWLRPLGSRPVQAPVPDSLWREAVVLAPSWRVELSRHEQAVADLRDAQGHLRASLVFEGTTPVRARFTSTTLVCFDARGRVVWLDLQRGTLHRVPVL